MKLTFCFFLFRKMEDGVGAVFGEGQGADAVFHVENRGFGPEGGVDRRSLLGTQNDFPGDANGHYLIDVIHTAPVVADLV